MKKKRCYYCHQVDLTHALYNEICLRHQVLITLRFCWRCVRRGQWKMLWSMIRRHNI